MVDVPTAGQVVLLAPTGMLFVTVVTDAEIAPAGEHDGVAMEVTVM